MLVKLWLLINSQNGSVYEGVCDIINVFRNSDCRTYYNCKHMILVLLLYYFNVIKICRLYKQSMLEFWVICRIQIVELKIEKFKLKLQTGINCELSLTGFELIQSISDF